MKLNVIGKEHNIIKSFDFVDKSHMVDSINLVKAGYLDPDFLKATGRAEYYDFSGVEIPVSKSGHYLAVIYDDGEDLITYLFNPNHCRLVFDI